MQRIPFIINPIMLSKNGIKIIYDKNITTVFYTNLKLNICFFTIPLSFCFFMTRREDKKQNGNKVYN